MPENTYAIVQFIPGGVYRLRFPNGKSYIGQAENIKKRFNYYKYGDCKGQPKLYHALKKYGWNDVKVVILFRSDQLSVRIFWEIYYIMVFDSMRNGYNCTMGGEGNVGYKHTDKTKKEMSITRKGRHLSEEHKRKIGNAHKGIPRLEETKRKIATANTGKKHTKEAIQKMRIVQAGKHHTKEAKRKISESLKGRFVGEKHPMYGKRGKEAPHYGKPHSKETKENMSKTRKGKFAGKNNPMYGKRGKNSPHYGKPHTKETIQQMSEARKAWWQKRKSIILDNTKPKISQSNTNCLSTFDH